MKKFLAVIVAGLMLATCFGAAACNKGGDETKEEYKAYPLLNAGFEDPADGSPVGTAMDRGWDYSLENGMMIEDFTQSSEQKTEGEYSVKIAPVIGGYISLYQVMPLEGEDYAAKFDAQFADQKTFAEKNGRVMPKRGDVVEATADIYIGGAEQTDYSAVRMFIEQENSKKSKSVVAQSEGVNLKYGQWNTVSVSAVSNGGAIRDDSVLILVSFKIDVAEESVIYIDNVQVGTRRSGSGGGSDSETGYASRGSYVSIEDNSFERGNELFKIAGQSAETTDTDAYYGESSIVVPASQSAQYTLSTAEASLAPETAAAGIWVKIPQDASGSVKLSLKSRNADAVYADVTEVSTSVKGRWVYLKTPEADKSAAAGVTEQLRVTVGNNTDKDVFCDFVQVGDWQRINGNPVKMAFMAYQPWFRNNGAEWGNWKYDSSAGAANGGRLYDPAAVKDGRRDIASVYYPVIGVYDSVDIEVLSYHADLIKAMGCDVVQVNYYADLASAKYQLEVLDNLFAVCAERDMKVSILYEPKIHLNGWIPHASREESIEAMGQDLIKFIEKYDAHSALLRYNDAPMIEVFGLNLVTGAEWGQIKAAVKTATGYDIPLMGDGVGSGDYSNVMSMFQWTLYNGSLKECDAAEALEYCRSINARALEWAESDVGNRLAVGLAYPGFDDTPVMSWDPAKGVIRKIGNTGEEFYAASWQAVLDLKDRLDWVLVATFNDWTEGTIIEPTVQLGHALATLTQENIAAFKGVTNTVDLEAITENYLSSRGHDYNDLTFHYSAEV